MLAEIVLIALALLMTFFVLKRLKKSSFADKNDVRAQIKFDEEKLELIEPGGKAQTLLWSNITLIAVKTTDRGPVYPDVFWQFYTNSEQAEMIFPQGTVGEEDLLIFMANTLTGFDYQQVINAMGSTDNALFIIWSTVMQQSS